MDHCIPVMQKLSHAVDLIVVLAGGKPKNLVVEVVQPRRSVRDPDFAALKHRRDKLGAKGLVAPGGGTPNLTMSTHLPSKVLKEREARSGLFDQDEMGLM